MFESSSPFADYVDSTFLAIVGLSTLVLIGIIAVMIYFVIRYNRKRNPVPKNIEGNTKLEVLWTAVPFFIFLGMFYAGWRGYLMEIQVPDNAIPVKVTGQMWKWTFEYPNGLQLDTLYVPVGAPVKLTLISADVNHSLYIPAFRIKKDVIPGRENIMWFKTPRVASYDIACAEYCGLLHAYMYTKMISMDSVNFEQWYRRISSEQNKPYKSLIYQTE